tara:strand:+ start:765 stop:1133 length:369 start_codon:yes stop_codon:yes gene_type:complete
MKIRLKINHSSYLLSSDNNAKLIEFAGMFFSPEIKIQSIDGNYITIDETNSKKMSNADLNAIKKYCSDCSIDTFQFYETTDSVAISMADEPLKTKTTDQEGLQKLIKTAENRPQAVNLNESA